MFRVTPVRKFASEFKMQRASLVDYSSFSSGMSAVSLLSPSISTYDSRFLFKIKRKYTPIIKPKK